MLLFLVRSAMFPYHVSLCPAIFGWHVLSAMCSACTLQHGDIMPLTTAYILKDMGSSTSQNLRQPAIDQVVAEAPTTSAAEDELVAEDLPLPKSKLPLEQLQQVTSHSMRWCM